MANIDTMFPSQYVKAAELVGRRVTVKMSHVKIEEVGDDKKPVLYFNGTSKGLVLNVTNANMIKEITGSSETEDWRGKPVTLYVTKTEFQGKRVDAIRVDYPTSGQNPTPPPVPVAAPAPFLPADDTFASGPMPDSDDIPF
jgi:hypothetical protein